MPYGVGAARWWAVRGGGCGVAAGGESSVADSVAAGGARRPGGEVVCAG